MYRSSIYTFYITLLLVLTSGAVIGQIYYQQGVFILLVSSLLMIKNKINKEKIIVGILFTVILFSNYLLTEHSDISAYIGLFLKIISVMIIFNSINITKSIVYYIYILLVVCITSLLFYSFGLFNEEFIRSSIPVVDVWGHKLRFTPFYVYQDWNFNRNNGIFWEPGAFQAFINTAVFFTIKSSLSVRRKKFILFILIITLITTFSTTGYLILGLIMIFQLKAVNINKYLVFVILLFLGMGYFIQTQYGVFSVIIDKFDANSDSYSSYAKRTYDLMMGIDLISRKPIVGWGMENSEMYDGYRYASSSNGLVMLAAQFGIFTLASYIIYYLFCIKKIVVRSAETVVILSILLIFFSTENLIFQPLFLAPLFISYRNNKLIKGNLV